MKKIYTSVLILVFLVIFHSSYSETCFPPQENQNTIPIDLVFCIDVSGSTNGLLELLGERLPDIINEIKQSNSSAIVRVSIVGYGRPSFGETNGYSKVIIDLTDDFDFIINELFSIPANIEFGKQHVGMAIQTATKNVSWSKEANTIKVIYLMGNGMVNLGDYEYQKACEEAMAAKITVNALYWKSYFKLDEIAGWKRVAELGKGGYYAVEPSSKFFLMDTPYDVAMLRELNFLLNNTFVHYGIAGKSRFKMIEDLDKKISKTNEMLFQSRIILKVTEYSQGKNQNLMKKAPDRKY